MAKQETDYSSVVAQAEKAVKGVSDPELKRIAFQKVLEDLLGGGVGSGSTSLPRSRTTKRKKSVPSTKTGTKAKRNKAKKGGPKSYIRELINDGFFKKPKTITEIKAQLGNRGHHIPLTSLSTPLIRLCRDKELRRQKGDKNTFLYSNW